MDTFGDKRISDKRAAQSVDFIKHKPARACEAIRFFVSLALALGLSELAGRNTKIESLFIDEGFGSLDNDTLDVALSALENLRLQNRTIGVISHVEDLKIRINTQIQVTRRADGHATLSVVE